MMALALLEPCGASHRLSTPGEDAVIPRGVDDSVFRAEIVIPASYTSLETARPVRYVVKV